MIYLSLHWFSFSLTRWASILFPHIYFLYHYPFQKKILFSRKNWWRLTYLPYFSKKSWD